VFFASLLVQQRNALRQRCIIGGSAGKRSSAADAVDDARCPATAPYRLSASGARTICHLPSQTVHRHRLVAQIYWRVYASFRTIVAHAEKKLGGFSKDISVRFDAAYACMPGAALFASAMLLGRRRRN